MSPRLGTARLAVSETGRRPRNNAHDPPGGSELALVDA